MKTAGVTDGVTCMVMLLEPATAPVEVVTTQRITSPSVRVLTVKVELPAPVFIPFIFHWYDGLVPPLVVVAENVTLAPEQISVPEAVMAMEGGR